jgi:hypothetical protein
VANILSGEWQNERINNVLDRIEKIIDRLLLEGLLSSGFLVLEPPMTVEFVSKLTPKQFGSILNTLPTIEAKSEMIKMLKAADVERILRPPLV